MQYSNYFKAKIKENGIGQLSPNQQCRIINIFAVERSISTYQKLKNELKGTALFYKFDVLMFKEQKLLVDLTGNQKPKDILMEMFGQSEF